MKIVYHDKLAPEETVALDEYLLLKAENGSFGESLRFWAPGEYFAVIGRAEKAEENCFIEACERDGVKVVRRISGGGTILQGPGCFNYSAVISYERDDDYRDINTSYRNVLGRLAYLLREKGYAVRFYPVSDLAVSGRKISGNAQARKRSFFLQHGTFLLDFDIGKISRYLKHPMREPGYRRKRSHEDFVANIPISEHELKRVISSLFSAGEESSALDEKDMREVKMLVKKKYSLESWNYSFSKNIISAF